MYLPFQAISNKLVGPRIVSNLFENALRFQLCREQASPPQHTTHTKPRHGKRHDTANNTVTHIVGLPWSNISNFKRAVGLAMMKGLYVLCSTESFESARAMLLD